VKDISYSLEEAGAVILLGQSGSGKTMTCRAILGLLNSSAFQVNGEIFFDNRSLLQLKEKERALYYGNKIAFIPQNPMTALDPSRKIGAQMAEFLNLHQDLDRKSTRLNSSHVSISYAVFCLKKKTMVMYNTTLAPA